MKKTRVENRYLLDQIKKRPCSVFNCMNTDTDPAHIKTRGSGGDDTEDNLLPLCRKHHIEQGYSWIRFCQRYPEINHILFQKGWTIRIEFNQAKLVRL